MGSGNGVVWLLLWGRIFTWSSQLPCEGGIIIIPILQRGKLRLGEAMGLPESSTLCLPSCEHHHGLVRWGAESQIMSPRAVT